MKFFDYQVNHTSTTNIFPKFENFIFLKLSTDIYIRYMLKFQIIDYELDMGFIFEEKTKFRGYSYVGYDNQINLVDKRPGGNGKLGMFDIILDPTKKVFSRSYVKLQTVAANIGGVAKFFLLLGEFVSTFYLQSLFNLELCNSFFNYTDKNGKSNDESKDKLNSDVLCLYKSNKIKMIDEKDASVLINLTSKSKINFSSIEKKNFLNVERKKDVVEMDVRPTVENNYVQTIEKSNLKIKLDKESLFDKSKSEITYDELNQSFFNILLCPTKKFKKSKEMAFNLLSYEKLIHNVIELSELKDYIINDLSLKYSGNCKLDYIDS